LGIAFLVDAATAVVSPPANDSAVAAVAAADAARTPARAVERNAPPENILRFLCERVCKDLIL